MLDSVKTLLGPEINVEVGLSDFETGSVNAYMYNGFPCSADPRQYVLHSSQASRHLKQRFPNIKDKYKRSTDYSLNVRETS